MLTGALTFTRQLLLTARNPLKSILPSRMMN